MNDPCYIALDIGGTKTAVSLWEGETTLLQKIQFSTLGSPTEVIAKALDAIDQLTVAASIDKSRLAAVTGRLVWQKISCSLAKTPVFAHVLPCFSRFYPALL
jgi:predicted NBD/HSP70 family sugar kinase